MEPVVAGQAMQQPSCGVVEEAVMQGTLLATVDVEIPECTQAVSSPAVVPEIHDPPVCTASDVNGANETTPQEDCSSSVVAILDGFALVQDHQHMPPIVITAPDGAAESHTPSFEDTAEWTSPVDAAVIDLNKAARTGHLVDECDYSHIMVSDQERPSSVMSLYRDTSSPIVDFVAAFPDSATDCIDELADAADVPNGDAMLIDTEDTNQSPQHVDDTAHLPSATNLWEEMQDSDRCSISGAFTHSSHGSMVMVTELDTVHQLEDLAWDITSAAAPAMIDTTSCDCQMDCLTAVAPEVPTEPIMLHVTVTAEGSVSMSLAMNAASVTCPGNGREVSHTVEVAEDINLSFAPDSVVMSVTDQSSAPQCGDAAPDAALSAAPTAADPCHEQAMPNQQGDFELSDCLKDLDAPNQAPIQDWPVCAKEWSGVHF